MLAVHIEEGRVLVKQARKPRRREGYALIRLQAAGICNTDIELQRGYYDFRGQPGHEFVGQVVEAGTPELIGKRVVGEINIECGKCDWCRRGLGRHCPNRTVLGIDKHPGVLAEYFTLPEKNLHVVPKSVPTSHAVFAEPLAAACEILDQVRIPKGSTVAVLGDGKLGLLVAQVLKAHGAKVHQFGRHRSKLKIAELAGVEARLANNKMPVAAYDWVVEATGSSEGLETAAGMVRPRGTIIMKSTVHGTVSIDIAPLVVNEITLIGSRCGRFEPAMRLLRGGKIHLDEMISKCFRLSQAEEAFLYATGKGVLKVLLIPDAEAN